MPRKVLAFIDYRWVPGAFPIWDFRLPPECCHVQPATQPNSNFQFKYLLGGDGREKCGAMGAKSRAESGPTESQEISTRIRRAERRKVVISYFSHTEATHHTHTASKEYLCAEERRECVSVCILLVCIPL